ncbi:MAG: TMEM175 family protein [Acidimicrobiia bacterium]
MDRYVRELSPELERVVFFSDAVFAIAITLMVIELRIPDGVTPSELPDALRDLSPRYFSFLISFAVIGVFWIGHYRMFRFIRGWDHGLLLLNLLFLLTIAFLPFPTSLIGRFSETQVATTVYSASVLGCAIAAVLLWWYASTGRRLLAPDVPYETIRTVRIGGMSVASVFVIALVVSFFSPSVASLIWWLAFPTRWVVGKMLSGPGRREVPPNVV